MVMCELYDVVMCELCDMVIGVRGRSGSGTLS